MLEHQLGLIQVVPLEVGQRQVIGGVDVQSVLDLLGIVNLFLSVTRGAVFGESELDVVLDRFIELAAKLLDPRVDQGEFAAEQEQRRLDRGDELRVGEEPVSTSRGNAQSETPPLRSPRTWTKWSRCSAGSR